MVSQQKPSTADGKKEIKSKSSGIRTPELFNVFYKKCKMKSFIRQSTGRYKRINSRPEANNRADQGEYYGHS